MFVCDQVMVIWRYVFTYLGIDYGVDKLEYGQVLRENRKLSERVGRLFGGFSYILGRRRMLSYGSLNLLFSLRILCYL